jgi:sugar phosphate isomerase/epimerase
MAVTRRKLLAACAAGALAGRLAWTRAEASAGGSAQPLGMVLDSFPLRRGATRSRPAGERLQDPLVFLEHCHGLGARGIQTALGACDEATAQRLKERAESYGMYLEGTIRLPRDAADVGRFEAEVQSAELAGVTVLRTVMLSGRRYEVFHSNAAFRRFAGDSFRSLTLAAPVVARRGLRLAVENHKDWLARDLVAIIKRIGNPHVGICLDTGNNIALLEDPHEVVETLAPLAFTTHLKDMAVQEYARGFLLSEVPLGQGFLDLPRIVRVVRQVRPEIHLNLEMITRDPLEIPCLTPGYWATFPDRPAADLARMLSTVRAHAWKEPLPRIAGLSLDQRLEREDANVARCLEYAQARL